MITTDHNKIAHKLKGKNWEKHHIAKTMHILKKRKKTRSLLDKTIHWIALFIAVLGNMVILAGITPVMIEMPQTLVLIIVGLIGLCFGLLIDVMVRELDAVTLKHYVIAGVFIPVVATVTLFVAMGVAKSLAISIGLSLRSNPLLVALIYIICFILPHISYKVRERKEFLSLTK